MHPTSASLQDAPYKPGPYKYELFITHFSVVGQWGPTDPQTLDTIANAAVYPVDLMVKPYH